MEGNSQISHEPAVFRTWKDGETGDLYFVVQLRDEERAQLVDAIASETVRRMRSTERAPIANRDDGFPLIFTSFPAIEMQGWPGLWFHPFTVEHDDA